MVNGGQLYQAVQIDREAAADFICARGSIANYNAGYPAHEAEQIRAGKMDGHALVQAFARHRLTASGHKPATSP